MKLVSDEEGIAIMAETRAWVAIHNIFASASGIASIAAAEYWLNQQGKTLYPFRAEGYEL